MIEYHHRYLYAGDNIVAIYDADTDELIATLLHDEGIDTPLSISVYPTTPLSSEEQYRYDSLDESEQYLFRESRIQTYYYHRDHQNSILSLTDKEGKIVESYSYDAYGKITHSTKSVETYNPYGYTGREIDADDLYYYRARYYDPTIGRFITPDPIGFMGGDTNFYRYVGNDPVNFIDDSGFTAKATGKVKNPVQKAISKTGTKTNTVSKKIKPSNGGGKAPLGGTSNGTGGKIVDPNLKEKPYIPHAIVFFIGGAGDQEAFFPIGTTLSKMVGNGPNHNINHARLKFEHTKNKNEFKHLIPRIHEKIISYSSINESIEIAKIIKTSIKLFDDIDIKHGKRTLIYIVGHSLGGWNGAHLTEQLSKRGYTTEMLITLDPVGTHHFTSLSLAEIYKDEPNVRANKWINIRCQGGSYNFPDFVADVGGQWYPKSKGKRFRGDQWIPKNATPTIQVTTPIHHENADDLFTVKIGTSGKSALDNLFQSLQEKIQ